jgi:hypothetical protein
LPLDEAINTKSILEAIPPLEATIQLQAHGRNELWGLVALAQEMPRMTPEHYGQAIDTMGSQGEMGYEHAHGENGHEKEESGHNHSEKE